VEHRVDVLVVPGVGRLSRLHSLGGETVEEWAEAQPGVLAGVVRVGEVVDERSVDALRVGGSRVPAVERGMRGQEVEPEGFVPDPLQEVRLPGAVFPDDDPEVAALPGDAEVGVDLGEEPVTADGVLPDLGLRNDPEAQGLEDAEGFGPSVARGYGRLCSR
jgi:hypothetical protein